MIQLSDTEARQLLGVLENPEHHARYQAAVMLELRLAAPQPTPVTALPKDFVEFPRRYLPDTHAACLDANAKHCEWLMWKHPNGTWVSLRPLTQVELDYAKATLALKVAM